MKALNFKPVIFVLAALLGAGSLQAQEVKKTLKEEFKTNKSTSVFFLQPIKNHRTINHSFG